MGTGESVLEHNGATVAAVWVQGGIHELCGMHTVSAARFLLFVLAVAQSRLLVDSQMDDIA